MNIKKLRTKQNLFNAITMICLSSLSIYADENNFNSKVIDTSDSLMNTQISRYPIWLNSKTFAIINKKNRVLDVYKMMKDNSDPLSRKLKIELVQTINTNSPLIQFTSQNIGKSNSIFYGITKNNQILKFKFDGFKLKKIPKPQSDIKDGYDDFFGEWHEESSNENASDSNGYDT